VISTEGSALGHDRLLMIGGDAALTDQLRQRYPDCQLSSARTMLEGIDDLGRSEVRAVIACVDGQDARLCDVVAGLRDAAGERAKVLLCCSPETEPLARSALEAGADDYLILPFDGPELDQALGYVEDPALEDAAPAATLEELDMLGEAVDRLDRDAFGLLGRLADLVRVALQCQAVTLVVDGSAASSGGTVAAPILVEPIVRSGKTIGQVSVGGRAAPYRPADVEKLRCYAKLIGRVAAAAKQQRVWRGEALTDDMTGLYNRRYAHQFLDELLTKARTERFRVTVLLFDVDNFKTYNDTYGHAAGDEVICRVAQLFKAHCREHDVVTRYGGDEFCVIFWDADQRRVAGSEHPTDALAVLSRFREALKTYHCTPLRSETKGSLTISGGLASFPWDATTRSELIDRADQALLRAKQAGKNQVFIFGS
jgi:diguanylate cyclase (GGDEF)-like protein